MIRPLNKIIVHYSSPWDRHGSAGPSRGSADQELPWRILCLAEKEKNCKPIALCNFVGCQWFVCKLHVELHWQITIFFKTMMVQRWKVGTMPFSWQGSTSSPGVILGNLQFSKFDLDCSPSGDGGSSGMAYLSGMCSTQVFVFSISELRDKKSVVQSRRLARYQKLRAWAAEPWSWLTSLPTTWGLTMMGWESTRIVMVRCEFWISVSTSKLLYCKEISPCPNILEFKKSVIRREVHHGSQTKPWCHEVVAMH